MKMTNKQFCARLRRAKKIAMKYYPSLACINIGCADAGIRWVGIANAQIMGNKPMWCWVEDHAKSKKDIAAVFDNSIKNLGEEP